MGKMTKGEKRVLNALKDGYYDYRTGKKRILMKQSEIRDLTGGRNTRKMSISAINNAIGKLISSGKIVERLAYSLGGTIKYGNKTNKYKGKGYRAV